MFLTFAMTLLRDRGLRPKVLMADTLLRGRGLGGSEGRRISHEAFTKADRKWEGVKRLKFHEAIKAAKN